MRFRTIRQSWESYRAEVVEKEGKVPPLQLIETRRAFYAGMIGMFELVIGGLDDAPDVTQRDEFFMRGIYQEMINFKNDVSRGRA